MPKTIDKEKEELFKKHGAYIGQPGLWEEKWKGGDKIIMKHRITGEERPYQYTKKDKEMIKRGDLLQPISIEKDRYAEVYQEIPGEDQKSVDKFLQKRGMLKKRNEDNN